MATPYKVDVVTPDGTAFSGEAEIMVVPGSAGELGILAHHAPLISSLKPGRTHLTVAEGGERLEWATAEGFIEVRKNEALVLVSEAVRREDIDAGEARARLERARADLERAGDGDVFRAKREATFAEALVDVAEG